MCTEILNSCFDGLELGLGLDWFDFSLQPSFYWSLNKQLSDYFLINWFIFKMSEKHQ